MKAYKIKLNGEVITLKELMELNPREDILKEALDKGSATHDNLTSDFKIAITGFPQVDKIEIVEVDSINGLVNEVHDNAKSHGWWDGEKRTLGELIALMHSELSEALEEHRNEDILKHQNLNPNHYYSHNGLKPEGIAVELVDCVIRIMDLFGEKGWDFEEILLEKHAYNKTRPYKHGGKKI